MQRRENQRVLLTKRLLKEALLKLLEEKPLGQINVSELCRVADINRATFYKHYSLPEDVLREMEQEIARELRSLAPAEQTPETAKQYIERICAYLYDNRPLMRILLESKTDEDILEIVSETNRRYWSQFGENNRHGLDEDSAKLMVTYFSAGTYYMIRRWLLDGVEKTPREVAELVFRLVTRM